MKRWVAVAITTTVATAALAVTVILGGHHSSHRLAEAAAADRALATVKREARADPGSSSAPAQRTREVCPREAEGLAAAALRALEPTLIDRKGVLDLAALAETSNLAIAAARYLERARAAPALPQRLGRERDEAGQWRTLTAPTVGCALIPQSSTATESESANPGPG